MKRFAQISRESNCKCGKSHIADLAPDKPARLWTQNETLAVAKYLRKKASPRDEEIVHAIAARQVAILTQDQCGTALFEDFQSARKRLVTDGEALQSDFDAIMDGDGTRQVYSTTNFNIDFTVDGPLDSVQDPASDTALAVTLADGTVIGNTVAGNGIPDFVEILGIWLEYYLAQYIAFGFNNPAATGPLEVIIEQNSGSYTGPGDAIHIDRDLGSTGGLATLYNTSTAGMGVTPGHELFHQVQYTYGAVDNNLDGGFLKIYKEGTARWAEDAVNDAYNRYNKEVPGYLTDTNVSLLTDVDHLYQTVLFWKYFTEQHGSTLLEPQRGVDAMLALWNNLVGAVSSADGLAAIETTITALGGVGLQETFANFATANFVKDLANPFSDPVYEYDEDEDPNFYSGAVYSNPTLHSSDSLSALDADYTGSDSVVAWGVKYHEFLVDATVQDLTITIAADAAFTEPFYRIIAVSGSNANVQAGNGASFSTTVVKDITDAAATLDRVIVAVGAYNVGGDYDIAIGINEGVPSVMLVIDHSGSMTASDKMTAAIDSANLFVDLAHANGIPGLGAVGFSNTAAVLANSSLLSLDDAHRLAVQASISALTPYGGTSIGGGLTAARNELLVDPVGAAQEVIVLLTDGMENVAPMIDDVDDNLVADGTKVYVVGLGEDTEIEPEKLEDLALLTGGDYRMTSDPAVLQEFYLQILASLLNGDMDDSDSAATNASAKTTGKDAIHDGQNVYLSTADRRWNVIMSWPTATQEPMDITLVAPTGKRYSASELGAIKGNAFGSASKYIYLSINLPVKGAHAGPWKLIPVVPQGFTQVTTLKSFLISGIDCNLDGTEEVFLAGDPFKFGVELTEFGTPLPHAEVTILSETPLVSIGTYLAGDANLTVPSQISGDLLSAKQQKLSSMVNAAEVYPFPRTTTTLHLRPKSRNSGVYVNTQFTASVAGSYNFTIKVKCRDTNGNLFYRYRNFTKVVRVNPSMEATRVDASLLDAKAGTVKLSFTPADLYGNLLGPGYANAFTLNASGCRLVGGVQDLNNGTYTVSTALTPGAEPRISILGLASPLLITANSLRTPLEDVTGVEPAPPVDPRPKVWNWIGLVALGVALTALVLAIL